MRPRDRPPPALTEAERIERAAAILAPIEREVLVLSAGHGLRNCEIAARLGIGERRARRILARALRKFDRALAQPQRPWWHLW